jgi:hypothetical protein
MIGVPTYAIAACLFGIIANIASAAAFAGPSSIEIATQWEKAGIAAISLVMMGIFVTLAWRQVGIEREERRLAQDALVHALNTGLSSNREIITQHNLVQAETSRALTLNAEASRELALVLRTQQQK